MSILALFEGNEAILTGLGKFDGKEGSKGFEELSKVVLAGGVGGEVLDVEVVELVILDFTLSLGKEDRHAESKVDVVRKRDDFPVHHLTGSLGGISGQELDEAEPSTLVAVADRHSSGDHLAKLGESLMEVLVGPVSSEAFHEDIRTWRTVPQQLLVIRQGSAALPMKTRELDLIQKSPRLHDVWEATKSVVEVLERRPKKKLQEGWGLPLQDDFTVTD